MAEHTTGTREQWLAARLELLDAEKELTRRSDELARRRQQLPWVRVEKDYRFETDEGGASLADLYKGRSQLLMYHFMFGPEYTAGCPACSAIADGFNGSHVHLENHDVVLTAVSRAPIAKLQQYKRRMGWTFPWAWNERLRARRRGRLPHVLRLRPRGRRALGDVPVARPRTEGTQRDRHLVPPPRRVRHALEAPRRKHGIARRRCLST